MDDILEFFIELIAEVGDGVIKSERTPAPMKTSAFIFLMVVYAAFTVLCVCGAVLLEELAVKIIFAVLAATMLFIAVRTC